MKEEIGIEEAAPLWVIVITVFGAFLRFFLLDKQGAWLDETFSLWMANHNVADMLPLMIKIDQHPPLYYLLLHYWMAFNGDTPYYARMLSALFGAATLPVIYLIGKRIGGAVLGLTAAVLLALSLFNIYYAQEARMYTLLTFNAAVAIYALVRLLTDSRSVRPIGSQFREYLQAWRGLGPVEPDPQGEFSYQADVRNQTGWRGWIFRHRWLPVQRIETDLAWVALIVFSAATLLTHNTAVFFALAINLFVLGLMLFQGIKPSGARPVFQAPSPGNWVKAQTGIFLLWCPWLLAFIQQAGRVNQEFWIAQPDWNSVTQTLRALLNSPSPSQAGQVVLWVLGALLCLGLVYFRKKLSIFLFLASLFAIPVVGELIVSLRRPIFLDRTLIWITIPLLVVLAAGIAQLRYKFLMMVMLGALGAVSLFAAGDYYRYAQKENWSDAAGYVAHRVQKDDLILFNSAMVQIPFDYYFVPVETKNYLEVEKQGVPDMFNRAIPEPRMTTGDIPGLMALLRGHKRVWLVYSHESYTDPAGLVPQTLASEMKLIEKRDFYGGQVQFYEAP